MSDNQSNESRRKLLKSIAAGGGAIVAGKSLPDKWTAPVVDSVLLPAHAQTSPAPTTTAAPPTVFTCTPDPQSVTSNEATAQPPHQDAIAIVFDGQSNGTLVIGDAPADVGCTNVAFMADSDPNQTTWDNYDVSCGIWTQSNASFGASGSSGPHQVDISGAPGQFRINFNIAITNGNTPAPTLTISGVSITTL